MIVLSREGEVLQQTELTEEQKSRMLEAIVCAFLDANPEVIRAKVAEYQETQ